MSKAKVAKELALNLISKGRGLGLGTGAGLAASTMMPEDAEGAIRYLPKDLMRLGEQIMKGKVKATTGPELAQLLEIPRNLNSKDTTLANYAFGNMLEAAIRLRQGFGIKDKGSDVAKKSIETFAPWAKGRDDLIVGLDEPEKALDVFLEQQADILRNDPKNKLTEKEIKSKIEQLRNIYKDAAGIYSPKGYFNLRDIERIPLPGRAFITHSGPMASTVLHELEHYLNYLKDLGSPHKLNASYAYNTIKKNVGSGDWTKNFMDPDSLNRMRNLRNLSVEEFDNTLLASGALQLDKNNRPFFDPEKFGEFIQDTYRRGGYGDAYAQYGNHFLDYDVFEPEKAVEILNDRVKMPKLNPLENERVIHNLAEGKYKTSKQIINALDFLQDAGKLVENSSSYDFPKVSEIKSNSSTFAKNKTQYRPTDMVLGLAGAAGLGATTLGASEAKAEPGPTPPKDYEPRKENKNFKLFNKGYLSGSEEANQIIYDKNLSTEEKEQKLEEIDALDEADFLTKFVKGAYRGLGGTTSADESVMNEYIRKNDPEQYGKLKGIELARAKMDPSAYMGVTSPLSLTSKMVGKVLPPKIIEQQLPKLPPVAIETTARKLPLKNEILSVLEGEASKEDDILKTLLGEE